MVILMNKDNPQLLLPQKFQPRAQRLRSYDPEDRGENMKNNARFRNVSWLAILLLILMLTPAMLPALEPPRPGEIEQLRRTGEFARRDAFAQSLGNHKVKPALLRKTIERIRNSRTSTMGIPEGSPLTFPAAPAAPPPAWKGMPTTGNIRTFALLIDFSDYPHDSLNNQGAIHSKLFDTGEPLAFPYDSLAAYYRRSSYGLLELSGGTTFEWYTTSYNRSTIVQTDTGRENLIKEVLNYYDSLGHDFSQYDNDGDGTIDFFIVIWTGPDTGWANFWWPYQAHFYDSTYTLDGKTLWDYSWQWEADPDPAYEGIFYADVAIHEMGHGLGLPDYYDYDNTVGPSGGVGWIDMMDDTWGDHNCFSKWLLGWITPTVVARGGKTLDLPPSGSSPSAVLVMPGISTDNVFGEYFLVQNRYRVGNDNMAGLGAEEEFPGDGLLIWHVDARLDGSGYNFLYNNSYTSHKLLRLMEADGLEQIEQELGADAGDYYTPGTSFGDGSFPSSKDYAGQTTGVEVSSIVQNGETYSAWISSPPGSSFVGVFRDGVWYMDMDGNGAWNPANDTFTYFGLPGDVPVTGDWDNTITTKIGVFRNGVWYLDMDGDGAWNPANDTFTYFGLPGDAPVTGDWDGTGATKIGVFRDGVWYLDTNGNGLWDAGADTFTYFGLPGDTPVTGQW